MLRRDRNASEPSVFERAALENMLLSHEDIIQDEDIKVFVDSLADSAVVIGLRAWVPTEKYWATRWELLENIKLTFDAEGIEIPYDQLTVHVKQQPSETVKGREKS